MRILLFLIEYFTKWVLLVIIYYQTLQHWNTATKIAQSAGVVEYANCTSAEE